MTRDDLRQIVDAAPCQRCALPKSYAVHSKSDNHFAHRYVIDRDALVEALAQALERAPA